MKHTVICSAISLFALSYAAPLLAHDYTGLIRAEKFTEVERLVNAKLAQDPGNHDALIAKVELSDVTSMFAMEEIKSTTRLPLSYLP